MPFPQSREGHGRYPEVSLTDGTHYEVQTEDAFVNVMVKTMHPQRFIDLLEFLRSDNNIVSVTIDGIQQGRSLITLSGPNVEVAESDAQHRFSFLLHVTRAREIDRDHVVRLSEESRTKLSEVLSLDLLRNVRQEA